MICTNSHLKIYAKFQCKCKPYFPHLNPKCLFLVNIWSVQIIERILSNLKCKKNELALHYF